MEIQSSSVVYDILTDKQKSYYFPTISTTFFLFQNFIPFLHLMFIQTFWNEKKCAYHVVMNIEISKHQEVLQKNILIYRVCIVHDTTIIVRVEGMPWPKSDTSYYHAQFELPD